jgi:hypothetical protein
VADGRCTYKVREDDGRAYYYETVYPETIELTC